MPLPSLFQRKAKAAPLPAEPPGDESLPVRQARLRARRRLIGAALLLVVGVVVFPLFFETEPRPLPSNIPIEAPRGQAGARTPALPPVARAPSPALTEPPAAAVSAAPPAAIEPAPASAPAAPAQPPRPEPPKATPAKPAEASAPTLPASTAASGAREGRFVVQVGAYTDPNTLRDVRAKVEKLGLKTFTQTVDTDAGKRTRVRVGPYATRQEAEGASAKLKGAGLPGNVLVL